MEELKQGVEREIDRMLLRLRNVIRLRGYTQLEVQAELGWGKSYISQLVTKQKALRVDQVLQVLDVIAMTPVAFYGGLYHWLEQEPEDLPAPTPAVEIERELERLLLLLENKIRQRGFTQVAIQDRLGGGRSYISQLLSQSKGVRYDQVLSILAVAGVEPSEFFFELHRPAQYHSAVPSPAGELAEIRRQVAELASALRRFGRVLVKKRLMAERDVPFDL